MLRNNNGVVGNGVVGSIAVVLLLSLAAACAPPRTTTIPAPPPPALAPPPPIGPPYVPPAPVAPPPQVAQPPDQPVAPLTPARPERPDVAAPDSAPPTAPPVAPGQRGKFVVLNFDNADVETVIQAASEIAGFNYVIGPGVSGRRITVQTAGRIPQEEVFGVLLAVLEVHGVTAIRSDNLYKIVVIEGARERAVPTIIGSTPDPTRVADEVITQIVPLRFATVADISNLLRPLMSMRGALIPHRETNILIVTDTAANIRRLLDIVRLVDVEVTLDELQIIPIRHADAAELEQILNRLFQTGRVQAAPAPGVPPAPAPAPTPGAPRPPGVPPGPAAVPGTEVAGATDRPPLIIGVRRNNSLIVHARRHDVETIRRLVSQLDVDIYRGRRVFIYYAENARARDLAATLNAIYAGRETVPTAAPTPTAPRRPGDPIPPPPLPPAAAPGAPLGPGPGLLGEGTLEGQVRFIADEPTNSIIVATFPHLWPEIEGTIKQLDRMPRQVLIEVLIAEITLTEDTALGLEWAIRSGNFRIVQTSPGTARQLLTVTPEVAINPLAITGLGGLTAFTAGIDHVLAILNALASDSRLNVLSNPHVMTSENKRAVINVSESVPIVTGQIASPVSAQQQVVTGAALTQNIEYRDAGVILTVTPRIGERGTVAIDVKQEVNAVGALEEVGGGVSRRFIKREAETSVVLLNNQTLVLGGLIQERRSATSSGIPAIKEIPILGYLFGARRRELNKTELILMITPRVIGTPIDAAKVTEQMRRVTPELERAIRQAPRQPTPLPPGFPLPAPPPPPPPTDPGQSAPQSVVPESRLPIALPSVPLPSGS